MRPKLLTLLILGIVTYSLFRLISPKGSKPKPSNLINTSKDVSVLDQTITNQKQGGQSQMIVSAPNGSLHKDQTDNLSGSNNLKKKEGGKSEDSSLRLQSKPEKTNPSAKADSLKAKDWNIVTSEDAKGAVDALYQAILWRNPDSTGGSRAIKNFTEQGWDNYVGNATGMISSREFTNRIVAKHSTDSIIHRMYSVLLNRCANQAEMRNHYSALKADDPGRIPAAILEQVKKNNDRQLFAGGYRPDSCALAK